MDCLLGILKRKGVDHLVDLSVQALPPELKETVFANGCDIVVADGVVEEDEKEFINKLQNRLGISGDQALTIVQVMVTKNKG